MGESNTNTTTIEKIYIKKDPTAYKLVSQINELGLKYKHKGQYYTNDEDLSNEAIEDIKWLCKKNNLSYEIKKEEIKDNTKVVKQLYKLIFSDNGDCTIRYNKNKQSILSIVIETSYEFDKFHITDYKNSHYFNVSFKTFNKADRHSELLAYLLENEAELAENYEKITELIFVLSVLLNQSTKELSKRNKLLYFKTSVLKTVKEKGEGGFLCNCVPGFYPEVFFYIRNNKIVSSIDDNYVSYYQELKILEYLHDTRNRKYIAERKTPTLYDLFIKRKLLVSVNGFETKAVITEVKPQGGRLNVKVDVGNNQVWLPKTFSQSELEEKVYESR